MKKRITSLALALALCLSMGLTGCGSKTPDPAGSGSTSTVSDGKVYKFRMGNIAAEDDQINVSMLWFADELNKRSDGRIQATVYPNGEFGGSNKEQLEMVMGGTLEFTTVPGFTIAAMSDQLKEFYISDYPYLLDTFDTAFKFYDSDIGLQMIDDLESVLKVHALRPHLLGYTGISCGKKSLVSPYDTANMKLRTSASTTYTETLKGWGASPTSIDWSECYTALQQGAVDGMCTTSVYYITSRFYEVQHYITDIDFIPVPHYPVINQTWYDSLPDDLKAIFDEVAEEYVDVVRENHVNFFGTVYDKLADLGCEVTRLTPEQKQVWIDASVHVWDDNADIVGADFMKQVREFLGK